MIPKQIGELALVAATLALAGPAAAAYDRSWYMADFWGGEYPAGFTISAPVTTMIRAGPDVDLVRSIECTLEAGATYHPWNLARVDSANLRFLTFSMKESYRFTRPTTATLATLEGVDRTMFFAEGEAWTYLAYLGEGNFLLEFAGETLVGDPSVLENSVTASPPTSQAPDEWLGLTCANAATGWLLLREVYDTPGFDVPNITGYGDAADRGN